jgi:hypothetical protein
MGVCLWFENPIACLFEQVVMPEHFIISGEAITQPNKDECLQLCWGCLLCVWLFFWLAWVTPVICVDCLAGIHSLHNFFMESLILAQDERWLRA